MVEQGELARLGRCFIDEQFEIERLRKTIRETRVESTRLVEQTNSLRALTSLNHQLARSCVEPGIPLVDQQIHRVSGERSCVLFAELKLSFQAAGSDHRDHLRGFHIQLRKSLAALDSGHA